MGLQTEESGDEDVVEAESVPVGQFGRSIEKARARTQERAPLRGDSFDETERSFDDERGEEPGETTQVFVRGIPFRARPLDVVELFEEHCGVVTRVEGMFHAGRASGRAWVTFEEPAAAAAALGFDRQQMDGRFIEVYPPWSRPARQALRQVTEGQGGRGPSDRFGLRPILYARPWCACRGACPAAQVL